jgi:hypothetical protein
MSYQATFGDTPWTLHMDLDGVTFVYFNHKTKGLNGSNHFMFMHTHSNEKKSPYSTTYFGLLTSSNSSDSESSVATTYIGYATDHDFG